MTQRTDWSSIYAKASDAALAFREAEREAAQSATVDRCRNANLSNGDPVCVCPICKRRRASDRAIADFDTFLQHSADDNDLVSIRKRVMKDLPKVTLENGAESREEILRPPVSKDPDAPAFQEAWHDADEFQRYLATMLPEIEYRIDGNPPEASTEWADTERRVRDFLEPLTDAPEVTKGTAGMSRRAYATEGIRLLDEVRSFSAMFASSLPDDDREGEQAPEHEQRWLRESFADIAVRAFNAGVLARAAGGKAMEDDAKRGAKTLNSARLGAAMTRRKTAPATEDVLRFMAEKIEQGLTQSAAARMAAKAGLGKTPASNRKLWARHYPK